MRRSCFDIAFYKVVSRVLDLKIIWTQDNRKLYENKTEEFCKFGEIGSQQLEEQWGFSVEI